MTLACGYIGAGLMGAPMVRRLLAAGTDVRLWARTPEKIRDLVEAGAKLAASPAELCRQADVVITCVSDTQAMRSVVFDRDGLAEGAASPKILVDMSTISPQLTIEMASRLHAETGMIWIDAPVSGGQVGAVNGTLAVMAGGPAEAIDKVRPMLAHLARAVTRVGDSGAGQYVKMLNQTLVSTTYLMVAEVLNFAERMGVDAAAVPEALRGGHGDSNLLQQIWPKMLARDFTVTGTLDTLMKDLGMVRGIAQERAAPMPLNAVVAEMIRKRIQDGHGQDDVSSLFKLYAS